MALTALRVGSFALLFSALVAPTAEASCDQWSTLDDLASLIDRAEEAAFYDLAVEKGIAELRSAEEKLGCLAEVAAASQLTDIYLTLGSFYMDLDRAEEATEAVGRAASVSSRIRYTDPSLNKATQLAFLQERDRRFLLPRAALTLEGETAGLVFAINGQPVPTGAPIRDVVPGWHFIQVGSNGRWTGTWLNVPEGEALSVVITGTDAALKASAPATTSQGQTPTAAPGLTLPAKLLIGAAAPATYFVAQQVRYSRGAFFVDGDPSQQISTYPRLYTAQIITGALAGAAVLGAGVTWILGRQSPQALGPTRQIGAIALTVEATPGGAGIRGTW